jgi:hypothetical protein
MKSKTWKDFTLIGAAIATLTASCFAQGGVMPDGVDPALKVKDGSPLRFKGAAKGVQIYSCRPAAGDPSKFAFDADHPEPDAVLTDQKGDAIIHHYWSLDPEGPTWEAKDGSRVTGKKLDPAQPRPGTIPWLLLQVVNHEGAGLLAGITFIQRLQTEGGTAPTGACDPAKTSRVRVPYKATYYFFGRGY